jgi:hypothetical protein
VCLSVCVRVRLYALVCRSVLVGICVLEEPAQLKDERSWKDQFWKDHRIITNSPMEASLQAAVEEWLLFDKVRSLLHKLAKFFNFYE